MAKSFRIMAAVVSATLAVQGALAADNPLARGIVPPAAADAPIEGTWNGTDLERRSACTKPEDEGNHGTYAEFDVSTNSATGDLSILQMGITGLQCSYVGKLTGTGATRAWSGTYFCGDGKHGTFTSRSILVSSDALAIHFDAKLDTTETCTIEAVIAGGRL